MKYKVGDKVIHKITSAVYYIVNIKNDRYNLQKDIINKKYNILGVAEEDIQAF